jgi:6-phosphogluconolactonase
VLAYALDKASGKATLVQRIASGGKVPWSFALSPDGRWMLVANEQSDEIRVFAVDARSGLLTATDKQLHTPRPVSITFASVR